MKEGSNIVFRGVAETELNKNLALPPPHFRNPGYTPGVITVTTLIVAIHWSTHHSENSLGNILVPSPFFARAGNAHAHTHARSTSSVDIWESFALFFPLQSIVPQSVALPVEAPSMLSMQLVPLSDVYTPWPLLIFCLPIMLYGCELLSPTISELLMMERVHRRIVRTIALQMP